MFVGFLTLTFLGGPRTFIHYYNIYRLAKMKHQRADYYIKVFWVIIPHLCIFSLRRKFLRWDKKDLFLQKKPTSFYQEILFTSKKWINIKFCFHIKIYHSLPISLVIVHSKMIFSKRFWLDTFIKIICE